MQNTKKIQTFPDYCTVGVIFILSTTVFFSLCIFISGKGNELIFDSNQVLFYGEPYRIFTSIYALYSWRDLFICIACMIYLIFLINEFERRVSTLYAIFHFFKVNLLIQLLMCAINFYIYKTEAVRNLAHSSSGIYPYTMYLFLRNSLINKQETVFFCCSPFPISKIVRALILSFIFVLFAPSLYPCLIVFIYWNLTRFQFCQKMAILKEGCYWRWILKALERILKIKSKKFIYSLRNRVQIFASENDGKQFDGSDEEFKKGRNQEIKISEEPQIAGNQQIQ